MAILQAIRLGEKGIIGVLDVDGNPNNTVPNNISKEEVFKVVSALESGQRIDIGDVANEPSYPGISAIVNWDTIGTAYHLGDYSYIKNEIKGIFLTNTDFSTYSAPEQQILKKRFIPEKSVLEDNYPDMEVMVSGVSNFRNEEEARDQRFRIAGIFLAMTCGDNASAFVIASLLSTNAIYNYIKVGATRVSTFPPGILPVGSGCILDFLEGTEYFASGNGFMDLGLSPIKPSIEISGSTITLTMANIRDEGISILEHGTLVDGTPVYVNGAT